MNLDEDFHVHSAFSDGASTLANNVQAPGARAPHAVPGRSRAPGHRVVPEFRPRWRSAATSRGCGCWPAWRPRSSTPQAGSISARPGRHRPGAHRRSSVPLRHRPGAPGGGERGPGVRRPAAGRGGRAAVRGHGERGPGVGFPPLVAHLFSLLPKIGLDEAMVPEPLLADLAKRVAQAGAMVEVNEKWSCPSPARSRPCWTRGSSSWPAATAITAAMSASTARSALPSAGEPESDHVGHDLIAGGDWILIILVILGAVPQLAAELAVPAGRRLISWRNDYDACAAGNSRGSRS